MAYLILYTHIYSKKKKNKWCKNDNIIVGNICPCIEEEEQFRDGRPRFRQILNDAENWDQII